MDDGVLPMEIARDELMPKNKRMKEQANYLCVACAAFYKREATMIKHLMKCVKVLARAKAFAEVEHKKEVDAFIWQLHAGVAAQHKLDVDEKGAARDMTTYLRQQHAALLRAREMDSYESAVKNIAAALRGEKGSVDGLKAREHIDKYDDTMATTSREARLKAYLGDKKIEHHFLGGHTGASCSRMRREEVLVSIESIVNSSATTSIANFLRAYRFIDQVISAEAVTPDLLANLRVEFGTVTRATTIKELAEDLRKHIENTSRTLYSEVPWYSCQDYWHLLQHHAHEQLLQRGTIGLFGSCGIENAHQPIKKDIKLHWSGNSTPEQNMMDLLKRWTWRCLPHVNQLFCAEERKEEGV